VITTVTRVDAKRIDLGALEESVKRRRARLALRRQVGEADRRGQVLGMAGSARRRRPGLTGSWLARAVIPADWLGLAGLQAVGGRRGPAG
jgi:hypothetical protein